MTGAVTPPLKLSAFAKRERQRAAEEAFTSCPGWRVSKKARLRDDRTFWRLTAMEEAHRWFESLPLEEVSDAIDDFYGRGDTR